MVAPHSGAGDKAGAGSKRGGHDAILQQQVQYAMRRRITDGGAEQHCDVWVVPHTVSHQSAPAAFPQTQKKGQRQRRHGLPTLADQQAATTLGVAHQLFKRPARTERRLDGNVRLLQPERCQSGEVVNG